MAETDRFVGVRFRGNTKIYFFSADQRLELAVGDKAVAETARGLELCEIVRILTKQDIGEMELDLKPIVRKAIKKDLQKYEINREKAEKALTDCRAIVKKFNLHMNLIKCDYTLDASKIIFTYTAEDRVDFRELLKELAGIFKCRIELRQVGHRDKAKAVGGIGKCGLQLCCTTFLGRPGNISIAMAKNQTLSLNVQKLSGSCGKLMCCLNYENEEYTKLRKIRPKVGDRVVYEEDSYRINSINVLSGEMVIGNSNRITQVNLSEVKLEDVQS